MYRYTKVHFTKRPEYYDVTLYYSKDGAKLRSSTGVRVLHKHLTSKGTILVTHPTLDQDLQTIHSQQQNIEDIVDSYIDEHGEKPSVDWLEQRLGKGKSKATNKAEPDVPDTAKVIVPDRPSVNVGISVI